MVVMMMMIISLKGVYVLLFHLERLIMLKYYRLHQYTKLEFATYGGTNQDVSFTVHTYTQSNALECVCTACAWLPLNLCPLLFYVHNQFFF